MSMEEALTVLYRMRGWDEYVDGDLAAMTESDESKDWEKGEDAHRNIPILTEDEELIWSGLGSMTAYLAAEREEVDDGDRT